METISKATRTSAMRAHTDEMDQDYSPIYKFSLSVSNGDYATIF